MKLVLRSLLAHTIALLVFVALWHLLAIATAHASAPKALQEISYPTIFGVVAASLFLARAIEQLLAKAGLLRSEQEKQIDQLYEWMFERQRGGALMIESLHNWHKPVETPSGTRFLWRDSGEHAASTARQMDNIESATLSTAKIALQLQDRIDHIAEDVERMKRQNLP